MDTDISEVNVQYLYTTIVIDVVPGAKGVMIPRFKLKL